MVPVHTSIEDDAIVQYPLRVSKELSCGGVGIPGHLLSNDAEVHWVKHILTVLLLEILTDIRLEQVSLLTWKMEHNKCYITSTELYPLIALAHPWEHQSVDCQSQALLEVVRLCFLDPPASC